MQHYEEETQDLVKEKAFSKIKPYHHAAGGWGLY